ncbi:MAG: S8 family peptidase [Ignavibacteria bacterium]|nr:S8 family peptidase [Ignavibacteria bacterium]
MEFKKGNSLYTQTLAQFNQRALERRRKVMPDSAIISLQDAPLFEPYLQSLQLMKAEIILRLRWNNYAVIRCDSVTAIEIGRLAFIKKIKRTATKLLPLSIIESAASPRYLMDNPVGHNILAAVDNCGVFRYGRSFNQAQILGVPEIHGMGILGQGALLTFLDTGFRWKAHESTKNANVLGEYDFIMRDSITGNEGADNGGQDGHGSIVFSTVCGFLQDSLIGIAPNASFLLAKTEDIPTEQHLEEDNYAAAVEWAEAKGTDALSSSLGYSDFNQPDEENYRFEDFDGKTTITAQVVNRAVERGVVCISAAGNEGAGDSTLITPSDADSVIAVAAVEPDGRTVTGFSSRGPRGDGKIKPDIGAQGRQVICTAYNDSLSIGAANGTSLATPLIAGTTALFLSVFPELRPWEIKKYLYETASNASQKNNSLGYGVANLPAAMMKAGIIISPSVATYPINGRQRVVVFIRSSAVILSAKLNVEFVGESHSYTLFPTGSLYQYVTEFPIAKFQNQPAKYTISVDDGKSTRAIPLKKGETFTLLPNSVTIPCGVNPDALPYSPELLLTVKEAPVITESKDNIVTLSMLLDKESDIEVTVYNSIGQAVYISGVYSRSAGVSNLTIPTQDFASGVYFVAAKFQGKTELARFLKY